MSENVGIAPLAALGGFDSSSTDTEVLLGSLIYLRSIRSEIGEKRVVKTLLLALCWFLRIFGGTMVLRATVRKKDGKEHTYWSVVENRRIAGGRVATLNKSRQRPIR